MEKQYRRVTDIDEKIKNISLPYFQWKVLFLVLEETSIKELVKTLDSDEKTVQEALDSLEQNQILEISGEDVSSTEEEPVEKEATETLEETEPVEEEKIEESEEEPDEIAADILAETEEAKSDDVEEPVAELLDDSGEQSQEEAAEMFVEEETEKSEESLAESNEDLNISEFDEQETTEEQPEDEEIKLEVLEETEIDETETEEKSEEESADISSFIDEIGSEGEESPEEEKSEKDEETIAEKKPEKTSTAGSKTVMVIDDSIVIRKMVEIALEDGDYNIITSNSGKDGLNLLDNENPDLVIVDMTLPDMSGIDLLKTVKASKGIPVIMLSGKDAPQQVENAKSAGADDFLPKPFRDDDLIEKVNNLLK